MRVSTTMAFELGSSAIGRQQSEILRIQQQLSTGRRVNTATDDPAAASRAVEVGSAAARNTQFIANQTVARISLAYTESTLGQFTDALEDVRALLIQAGNGAYSDRERANIAADLQARGNYLLSLANARDANGTYLFSGYQDSVQAFRNTPAGVAFQGDQGRRELQLSDGRSLPVSASGAEIFDRVRTGNGVFETAGMAANIGSGVIDSGQVVDASLLDGRSYRLSFHVVAGVTTYDIADITLGSTVSSGHVYAPGASINIAGMQVQISGAPLEGDRFDLAPSGLKSIFNTIGDAVSLLRAPAGSQAASAQLQMGIGRAVVGIDRGLDSVMLARTTAGAGLNELDSLAAMAEGRDLQYRSELSDLLDVDYTRAISDLARQQTVSQATQKAFVNVSSRSLFDLI